MKKVELIDLLQKSAKELNYDLPKNLGNESYKTLRGLLNEVKEQAKVKGLQPNNFINELKSKNDASSNSDIDDNSGLSFQHVEQDEGTDEPGTDEPGTDEPGTDEPGTDRGGEGEPGKPDVSESDADKIPIDNQLQKHLQSYQRVVDEPYEPLPEFDEKPKRRGKQPKVSSDGLITGYLLMFFAELLFPQLISFVLGSVTNKYKVNPNDIKLSEVQADQLRPIADSCAEHLQMHVNPIVLFSIVLGSFYMTNTLNNLQIKTRR